MCAIIAVRKVSYKKLEACGKINFFFLKKNFDCPHKTQTVAGISGVPRPFLWGGG